MGRAWPGEPGQRRVAAGRRATLEAMLCCCHIGYLTIPVRNFIPHRGELGTIFDIFIREAGKSLQKRKITCVYRGFNAQETIKNGREL
jgi:hypothetical protein